MKTTLPWVEADRVRVGVLAFVVCATLTGCGGADPTAPPKPDENAAKRQQEMNDFYNKHPLPKPKAR